MWIQVKLHVCLIYALIATLLDAAPSVPGTAANPQSYPVSNATQASAPPPVVTAHLVQENKSKNSVLGESKNKARDCTLEAIHIIVLKSKTTISQECMQILQKLANNAEKLKSNIRLESNKNPDLRKELKDLAEKEERYQKMSDEINQAEQLLEKKNFEKTEGFEEVLKNDNSDLSKKVNYDKDGNLKSYQISEEPLENSRNYHFDPFNDRTSKIADPLDEEQENFLRDNFVQSDEAKFGIPPAQLENVRSAFDDDVLVIPLRFLRKQFLIDQDSARAKELTAKSSLARNVEDVQTAEERDAARWLLHAILSADTDERKPGASPLQYDGLVDAAKVAEQNNEPFKSNAGKEKSSKILEEAKPLDVDNAHADRDNSKIMNRKSPQIREQLNREVLARVEDDISKLGEDLQHLKLKNKQ